MPLLGFDNFSAAVAGSGRECSHSVYLNNARAAATKGDYYSAIRILRAGLEADPLCTTLHEHLGYWLCKAGDYEAGIHHFGRAAELAAGCPRDRARHLCHMGRAHLKAGRAQAAQECFDAARPLLDEHYTTEPELQWVFVFSGWAQLLLGNVEAAWRCGQKVLEQSKGARTVWTAGAMFLLGACAERSRQKPIATEMHLNALLLCLALDRDDVWHEAAELMTLAQKKLGPI